MTDLPPPPTPQPPPPAVQPKPPGVAVASLVLGILSFVCLGPFGSIPAVICGHVAQGKIKAAAGTLGGYGIALAGLITGYVNLALSVLLIPLYLAIAIPAFSGARDAAMTNACINNLRIIDSAKDQWSIVKNRPMGETPREHDLYEYFREGALPTCPKGGAYTLGPVGEPPTCSVPGHALEYRSF